MAGKPSSFETWKPIEPSSSEMLERAEPSDSEMPERAEPFDSEMSNLVEPSSSKMSERAEPFSSEMSKPVKPSSSKMPERAEPFSSEMPEPVKPSFSKMPEHAEPSYSKMPERAEPSYSKMTEHAKRSFSEMLELVEPFYSQLMQSDEPFYSTNPTYEVGSGSDVGATASGGSSVICYNCGKLKIIRSSGEPVDPEFCTCDLERYEFEKQTLKFLVVHFNKPLLNEMPQNCLICLERFSERDVLGKIVCLHRFHYFCIREWLLNKQPCPICNTYNNLPIKAPKFFLFSGSLY